MAQTADTNHDACSCDDRSTARTFKLKADLSTRLNRIEGQVRGVKSMIDRDAYCDDVLSQITAVQSALEAVSRLLLKNHIQSCVAEKIRNEDPEIIEELIKTISRMR